MSAGARHLRVATAARARADRGTSPAAERDWLAATLLVVGVIPLAGWLLLGRWPSWELGAGTAMAVFALRQLVRRPRSSV